MFCSLSCIAISFKALSYSRAFESTAFISDMLIIVFNDMKFFFGIMIWVLIGFTFAGYLILYPKI